jgi:ribosome-interacting GTPase 1
VRTCEEGSPGSGRRGRSRLRQEGEKGRKSGRGDLYAVQREGAAQAALMGFANAGKSALVKSLTNANPVVADVGYEATDGWVSGIIRNANVVLLVVDLTDDWEAQADLLLEQLHAWRITPRSLLMAANKAEEPGGREAAAALARKYGEDYPVAAVSARTGEGLEELRARIYGASGVIRAYSKEPGKEADLARPFTVSAGTTVQELAGRIHKDLAAGLKFARVWGSVKIQGQKVQRDYVLKDRDVVEIHL